MIKWTKGQEKRNKIFFFRRFRRLVQTKKQARKKVHWTVIEFLQTESFTRSVVDFFLFKTVCKKRGKFIVG